MSFSFVQITDHHLGESDDDQPHGYPAGRTFRAVMDRVAADCGGSIDFLVSTGDLVNRPTAAAYRYLRDVLDLSPAAAMDAPHTIRYGRLWDFPIYLLPGNHDTRSAFFRSLFTGVQGSLFNISFLHKGVRMVCLDWGELERGTLAQETLAFARQALSGSEPALLMMHHNAIPMGRSWLDRYLPDGMEVFHQMLREGRVMGILCGHLHTSYEVCWEGIPVLGLRSTAFQFRYEGRLVMALQPPHYRVVTAHPDGRLETQVVEVTLV